MNLKGSMVVTGLTNQAQPRRRMCDVGCSAWLGETIL